MYEKEQYKNKSDVDLILLLRQGDETIADFLLEKYKNFVRKKARTMYLVGGDNEDLIQEGMIGLYKAIRDFNPSKDIAFLTFADLCITRQLYTAVQASLRKKHRPLNSYIPWEASILEEGGDKKEQLYVSEYQNPEELLLDQEQAGLIQEKIVSRLSAFEQEVLYMYIDGLSYLEIGDRLRKSQKSIDNALQRIKKKLGEILSVEK